MLTAEDQQQCVCRVNADISKNYFECLKNVTKFGRNNHGSRALIRERERFYPYPQLSLRTAKFFGRFSHLDSKPPQRVFRSKATYSVYLSTKYLYSRHEHTV